MIRPPFSYLGGKARFAKRIVSLLPPHTHYVEVFGGAAAVLFAKPPPPGLEIYNDIDGALVNFFQVVRDPEQFEELQRILALTLYSREERDVAFQNLDNPNLDSVERARCYYVAAAQGFSGKVGTRAWGFRASVTPNPALEWLRRLEHLPAIHERLQLTQIENRGFEFILGTYNAPETLVYCDPPYITPGAWTYYQHLMDETEHKRLVSLLLTYPALAIVSGYDNPIYRVLDNAGWLRHEWDASYTAFGTVRAKSHHTGTRREVLWLNPACAEAKHYQAELF